MPTTTGRAVEPEVYDQVIFIVLEVWSVIVVLKQPEDAALEALSEPSPLCMEFPLSLKDMLEIFALKLNSVFDALVQRGAEFKRKIRVRFFQGWLVQVLVQAVRNELGVVVAEEVLGLARLIYGGD